MSFWESEVGEVTGSAADAFAKSFTQIPDNTMALAKIDSFLNVEFQGFKYLMCEWLITDGDFKGAKVQQKLKVYGGDTYDKDPARTRHRALNMFKLLYQLFNMKPKHANDPTDQDLASFVGKVAGLKIRETEPNDKGRQYNWVAEVHSAQGFKCETGTPLVVTVASSNVSYKQEPIDSAFSRNAQAQDPGILDEDLPF